MFSLVLLLAAVFYMQPRAMSYTGLNLLFNLAVPIALATIAQMLIMAVNDLDLSMGTFVSFVVCVAATYLHTAPVIGVLILAAAIAAYAALGALIHLRNLPSIVVTLGMSFVWGGFAVLLLPSPGGQAPRLGAVDHDRQAAFHADGHCRQHSDCVRHAFHRDAVDLRRADARRRRQHALHRARRLVCHHDPRRNLCIGCFLRGACRYCAGGPHHIGGCQYRVTLYASLHRRRHSGGGGEFVGGRVSPIGAVIGALTLTLAGSFLSFMRISPDWQIGAQGGILIVVLALRLFLNRLEKREKKQ